MKVLGQYRITYENNITQVKNLIEHNDYINIVKTTQKRILELEMQQPLSKNSKKKIEKLKQELIDSFGSSWFTNESPLYKAIKTNILSLTPQQGGDHKCIVTKI